MENPMNKWMIWGETPLFLETPIYFPVRNPTTNHWLNGGFFYHPFEKNMLSRQIGSFFPKFHQVSPGSWHIRAPDFEATRQPPPNWYGMVWHGMAYYLITLAMLNLKVEKLLNEEKGWPWASTIPMILFEDCAVKWIQVALKEQLFDFIWYLLVVDDTDFSKKPATNTPFR